MPLRPSNSPPSGWLQTNTLALSDEQKHRKLETLKRWLDNPDQDSAGSAVNDLIDLAVNDLVLDAMKRYWERTVKCGAPKETSAELTKREWTNFVRMIEETVRGEGNLVLLEISSSIRERQDDLKREMLTGFMDYFSRSNAVGKAFDQERIQDCITAAADQVVVFVTGLELSARNQKKMEQTP